MVLHSGSGRQVLATYSVHSDKIEVDQNSSADKQRVELRTHALPGQQPTADEARVDYDVTVPSGVSVNVSTTSAPITAEGLSGDIGLSSETGQITISNAIKSHVRVRSMTSPVTLKDVTISRVDIQSAGGAVQHFHAVGSLELHAKDVPKEPRRGSRYVRHGQNRSHGQGPQPED